MKIYKVSSSYYSKDENPITKIKQDKYHKYQTVNGIMYELSGGNEQIVNINDIETTEGNTFYEDHIQSYINYLNNGSIIHTFPVQVITPAQNIDQMVSDLENSARGDMYEAPYWKFLDKYNIHYKELDRFIDLYNEKNELDEDEEKELLNQVENFSKMVENFYNSEIDDVYFLTDHNHRFEAVRRMGVKLVMVDIN